MGKKKTKSERPGDDVSQETSAAETADTELDAPAEEAAAASDARLEELLEDAPSAPPAPPPLTRRTVSERPGDDVSQETSAAETADTELDAPAEEAAAASDARLEELLEDAPSAPPAPPPLTRRTVALTCELREGESPNYAPSSLDVSLDGRQSQTLRRYADCCLADGARLADGRVVDDCGTAVRHLLERLAEADAGGPAAA